ncbi:hypothetical protein H2203_006824 [Taxawa tesnikishii (nom. ined.)]|nr:hypothetical protein H2203_006824 [Dothideales sp. JES 119]
MSNNSTTTDAVNPYDYTPLLRRPLFRTRTWFFIPFIIGGYFEVVAYISRADSANEDPNYTLAPFAIQPILALVAPALFAASIYMGLGRLILLTDGERFTPIRRTWLTKIFVLGDVLSFLAQVMGGAILANATKDPSAFDRGKKIINLGLILQILFFTLFLFVAFVFHFRLLRSPQLVPRTPDQRPVPWQRHLRALYLASLFILIRSVYRLVEYVQASGSGDGYLLSHEWVAYVFDALLMVVVMTVFVWWHPSEVAALLRKGGLVAWGVQMERLA